MLLWWLLVLGPVLRLAVLSQLEPVLCPASHLPPMVVTPGSVVDLVSQFAVPPQPVTVLVLWWLASMRGAVVLEELFAMSALT